MSDITITVTIDSELKLRAEEILQNIYIETGNEISIEDALRNLLRKAVDDYYLAKEIQSKIDEAKRNSSTFIAKAIDEEL